MSAKELLPCAHCGGVARLGHEHDPDGMYWSYVTCVKCGLRTRGKWATSRSNTCPVFYGEVRDEWNLRAPTPPSQRVPSGWIAVPDIGAMVTADHPQTCLNPDKVFEVVETQYANGGWSARGEHTCWFGIGLLTAAEDSK